METKSKLSNEYLIISENADYLKYNFENKEYKLIKFGNSCGIKNSDLIEFSDKEILKNDFLKTLNDAINLSNIKKIYFRLLPVNISPVLRKKSIDLLTSHGYSLSFSNTLFVNLKNSKDVLRKNLRKSYKSLVNKEKKKVKLIFLEDKNLEKSCFEKWIDLYKSVLNRGNKDLNNDAIKLVKQGVVEKKILISLAYEENILLGGMTFNINKFYASYSSAANTSEIETQKYRSIGHFLLWESIIKLKELNNNFIDLGETSLENTKNDKLKNIIRFKKGFGADEINTEYFEKDLNE